MVHVIDFGAISSIFIEFPPLTSMHKMKIFIIVVSIYIAIFEESRGTLGKFRVYLIFIFYEFICKQKQISSSKKT